MPPMPRGDDVKKLSLLGRLNAWHRLLVILGLVWALPILFFVVLTLPLDDELEIKSQWARARVNLTGEYYGLGELHAALRQRFYGNASDDEIIHSTQPLVSADELPAPVPVERVRVIDGEYEARITARRNPLRMPGIALLYWAVPLMALFFLGEGIAAFSHAVKMYLQRFGPSGRKRDVDQFHPTMAANERGIGWTAGRLVAWVSLTVVAAFYIEASLGWFAAAYAVFSGMVPLEGAALEIWKNLNPLDHAVRIAQVLAIVAASILLVLERRSALKLVLATAASSFLATVIMPKWTISFLSGLGGVMGLVVLAGYVHWLDRVRLYGRG